MTNAIDTLKAIEQGLDRNGIKIAKPFFVKYGRVPAMDVVSEVTGADVVCTLIGERPGLVTAESMSAYMAYKATVGMPEAKRTGRRTSTPEAPRPSRPAATSRTSSS